MNYKHLQDMLIYIPDLPKFGMTALQIGKLSWPGHRKTDEQRARHAAAVLRALHRIGCVQTMPCIGRSIYWNTDKGRAMRRRMREEASRGA